MSYPSGYQRNSRSNLPDRIVRQLREEQRAKEEEAWRKEAKQSIVLFYVGLPAALFILFIVVHVISALS